MSRNRPSDTFTRFTANHPHAAQKPAASSGSYQRPSQPASPSRSSIAASAGPDGETPAQKVARLRMQARAQKMNAQLSTVDRLLVTGRVVADRAHRITTYGLIGLAGVSAVVATYGLVNLVIHSRRGKRAWIEREMDRLVEAQQAFLRGEADAEQLHLLEQERAGEEMEAQRKREKERKKSEGIWSKITGLVGQGVAAGELGTESPDEARVRKMRNRGRGKLLEEALVEGEIRPVAVAESGIQGVGLDAKGRPVPINKMERVARRTDEERTPGEEAISPSAIDPGPLDVMAGNIADVVVPSKANSGWLSWMRGNSS